MRGRGRADVRGIAAAAASSGVRMAWSLVLAAAAAAPVHAQYKCKQANGATAFQQVPCPADAAQEKLRLFDDAPTRSAAPAVAAQNPLLAQEQARRRQVQEAIATGRPMVSMTAAELQQAMGNPDRVNAAQYGSRLHDQLIYHRGGRTLYVYLQDGVVTAIQNHEGTAGAARLSPPRRCPTAAEVRSIEIEISRIANRGQEQLQVELHRQLNEARTCR